MSTDHLVSHIKHPELVSDSTLHVVGVVSNPMRFHSRYRLFRKWLAEMEATPNVKVYVVELAFGDRHHEIADATNPNHLLLRSNQIIWHKESLISLGVKHLLPRDWKYACWCDGDVTFRKEGWALEAIHQMQHYSLIQPFRHALDLNFEGDVMHTFESFCSLSKRGIRMQTHPAEPYAYGHSGFSWCCTRGFWEATGGLMDFPILGSADHHMAWAAIGQVDKSVHGGMSAQFKRKCKEWQDKAFRYTKGNVGFVNGVIEHGFHGPKSSRRYRSRWDLFIKNGFNPDTDLTYDSQGLIQLVGKPDLERDIAWYMSARDEDSISE